MKTLRKTKNAIKKLEILKTAEKMVLENNQESAVHEIANALEIAKGTIYNSFRSKNHLYLELLILNERRLLELAKTRNSDIHESVSSYMLYHMQESNRTVLFHSIEERIASEEKKLKKMFEELYEVREQRIMELKSLVSEYLTRFQSHISVRDYLSYVWTITYGASLLLSSTYYQKSIGDRNKLMDFYIKQALQV